MLPCRYTYRWAARGGVVSNVVLKNTQEEQEANERQDRYGGTLEARLPIFSVWDAIRDRWWWRGRRSLPWEEPRSTSTGPKAFAFFEDFWSGTRTVNRIFNKRLVVNSRVDSCRSRRWTGCAGTTDGSKPLKKMLCHDDRLFRNRCSGDVSSAATQPKLTVGIDRQKHFTFRSDTAKTLELSRFSNVGTVVPTKKGQIGSCEVVLENCSEQHFCHIRESMKGKTVVGGCLTRGAPMQAVGVKLMKL